MSTVQFYTNPMSRGRIIRWMLEETGIDYDTHILTYNGTMKDAAYLAINPMGKVPAIVHGSQIVTECAAICAYLADAFPQAGLAPPSHQRAEYYRWMFFGAGPLETALSNTALGFIPPPEKERAVGYGNLENVLNTLDLRLRESPYIAGDSFTAADVYVGMQIAWAIQFGPLDEKRPSFQAYADRIRGRPAAIRANRLDEEAAA